MTGTAGQDGRNSIPHLGCSCVLIPLFDAEKQQKTPVQALLTPNSTIQAIDFIDRTRNSAAPRNSGIRQADQGN
jgi:hypothetical protein